jgi:predicted helicase
LVTARDGWLVDFDRDHLQQKVEFFCDVYEKERQRWLAAGRPRDMGKFVDRSIKWTSELEDHLVKGTPLHFDQASVARALYRPYVGAWMYYSQALTHRRYQMPAFFPGARAENRMITFLSVISSWPLSSLATDHIFDYCLLKQGNGATQSVGYWTYDKNGNRQENITDWAVERFRKNYRTGNGRKERPVTKEAIFHYVYAILHDPEYREKYSLDLKRELPRIPLYPQFWQWSSWGQQLMDTHIGYEAASPFRLNRVDVPDENARKTGHAPRPMLKPDKKTGRIIIDTETTLSGVPAEAWGYKIANRSALEWVLDQYKEEVPKDRTIRERFNAYRFADYKESVIELLGRVTTVSIETVKIVLGMQGAARN